MRKRITIVLVFGLQFAYGQSYMNYFRHKVVSDSLTRQGKYIEAIPHLRVCVSETNMRTVDDEFKFGYALFKAGKIDSSVIFLKRALANDVRLIRATIFSFSLTEVNNTDKKTTPFLKRSSFHKTQTISGRVHPFE